MAGNNKTNPNCVGENVSPQLSWTNPPAGTKSYVLLMSDPEGRGLGVGHWVAYGIPASVTGFAEGEISKQTDKYVGGKSTMNLPHLLRAVHAARRAAPLHLRPDRDRSRAEGAAARPDPAGAAETLDGHVKGSTGIIATVQEPALKRKTTHATGGA